jgi:hypothetical protein
MRGQRAGAAADLLVLDDGQVRRGGRAEHVDDEAELLQVVAAGEEGFAREELGEDAADGPHVDGGAVVLVLDE